MLLCILAAYACIFAVSVLNFFGDQIELPRERSTGNLNYAGDGFRVSGSSKLLLLCRMQPYAIGYVLSPPQASARIGAGAPPVANDNENMAHEEKSLDLASQALVFFYGRVCAAAVSIGHVVPPLHTYRHCLRYCI